MGNARRLPRVRAPHGGRRRRIRVGLLRRVVAAGVAVSLSVVGAAAVAPAAHAKSGDPITVPDHALKACVNDALNQGATHQITESQAASITLLSCVGDGVANVTGIEHFTGLTKLYLNGGHSISDVSPLASLTNLTTLWLDGNQISDVSPLASLTHLVDLGLAGNSISDVSPLASLTHLVTLGVGHNPLSDVSPLASLTHLTGLGMSWDSVSDVSPLASLTNLDYLYMRGNSISDVSPLRSLKNLTSLDLRKNSVSDVSPLRSLKNLATLFLTGNSVSDVSPLRSLTGEIHASDQVVDVGDVSVGTGVLNPVVGFDGEPVALTSADGSYDAASTTLVPDGSGAGTAVWDNGSNFSDTIMFNAVGVCPGSFDDVLVSNVHCSNISWLKSRGITKSANGKYHPTNPVTRGSMTAFLFRLTHPGQPSPKCTGKRFPDVSTSYVFCGYIQWAADHGVAFGYSNGTFRPGKGVARGAMAAFLHRIATHKPGPKCTSKPFADVPIDGTFCGVITWMKDNGITYGVGDGTNYGTTEIVSRQSMASFLHRIYNYMH